jgi:hypothetical protein
MLHTFSFDIDNMIDCRTLRSAKTESVTRFLPEGDRPDCSVTDLSPQHEHLVHVHLGTGNEEIIVALPYPSGDLVWTIPGKPKECGSTEGNGTCNYPY